MKRIILIAMLLITAAMMVFAGGSKEAVAETDGKTELVFWTRINDTFEEEIAAFEAAHPDVDVTRVGVGSDYDDLTTKYIASAVSGELPHVGLVSQRYGIPQLYDAGVLVPVDELMTEEEMNDVLDAYWGRYTYKERKEALPFQVSMPMLYVNLDLFNEYGVEIPRTWEEVIEAAHKLTIDTDGDGVTDIYGFNIPSDAPWYLNGMFKAAGADVIRSEKDVNFNQEEVVAVLETIQDLAADGCMPSNQHSSAKDDFKNGSVAMILNSCAGNGSIAKGVGDKFEYAMVTFPSINGNIYAPLGGNGLGVFKSNPEMEALAWEFVQFMTSTEAYSGFSMNKGYMPITKSSMEEDVVKARINDPFWAETYAQVSHLYGQPINPVDATIWNSINDILSIIEADSEADVAALVADTQSEIEDFLAEY